MVLTDERSENLDLLPGINTKIDSIVGATGAFLEQADTAVTINAVLAETDVLDLSVADTRYIVRSLRLKAVDPGVGETITVRLRELINDVSTIVDTFTIDTNNFGTHHSLMDMFGVPHLAGDDIHVTVLASAAGPYAITGQYSHAKAD